MSGRDDATVSFIDVLQTTFGEPLAPDMVIAAGCITPQQIANLSGQLAEWRQGHSLTPCGDGVLRPLVGSRSRDMLTAVTAGYGDLEDGPKVAGALRHLLVYAHEVALVEPLSSFLDRGIHDEGGARRTGVIQNFLPVFIAAFVSIQELLTNGVVRMVPDYQNGRYFPEAELGEWDGDREFFESLNALARVIQIPRRELESMAVSGSGDLSFRKQEIIVNSTLDYLIGSARTIELCGGQADLFLNRPYDREMIEWLLEGQPVSVPAVSEDPFLGHTLSVNLPGLSGLSDADIVRIRVDDETFAWWRAILSKHLLSLGDDTERGRLLELEVDLEMKHFQAESRQRGWRRRFRGDTRDFGIAALSTIAGTALFGRLSTATTAGVAGLAGRAVTQALLRRGDRDIHEAKLAHLALLK